MRAAHVLALLAAGCAGAPPLDPARAPAPILPAEGFAEDARGAFREMFCAVLAATAPQAGPCDAFLWRDPTEPPAEPHAEPHGALWVEAAAPLRRPWRVVMVSGYGSDCFAPWARMFGDARDRLAAIGAEVIDAPVAGLAGTEWNAAILADAVRALPEAPGGRIALIGYSKGAADMLEMLGSHPEAAARVDAAVSISGSLGGAQLAETAPGGLGALIEHVPGATCGPHDGRALWSLRPDVREWRLATHPRPPHPPLYVLASFVARDGVSTALLEGWTTLAQRGALSDGQLSVTEQTTQGAILLGHPRADHWASALPLGDAMPLMSAALLERNAYPRAALLEAVIRHLDRPPP